MIRKEPGYWIPYVIGAIAMLIVWPFAVGFTLTSYTTLIIKNEKWHPAIAILAVIVGFWFLFLARDYLGYDLAGTLSGYDDGH